METTFNCDLCGMQHPITEENEMDGLLICTDCMMEETEVCQHCGTRIWRGDNAGDAVTPLCQSCYDMYYTRCSECNEIIYESDAYYMDDDEDTPYCYHCAENYRRCSGIHAYSYKPKPIFRGEGMRFFGVELEIDEGGELEANAKELLKLAKRMSSSTARATALFLKALKSYRIHLRWIITSTNFLGMKFCIVRWNWGIYHTARIQQAYISMSTALLSVLRKRCRTEVSQEFCISWKRTGMSFCVSLVVRSIR